MRRAGHTNAVKAKSLGRSAVALATIGIIAKLIGALYRVPLTNIVGAEGMGLYQMVFPLYTVLLAFCGGGAVSAVSRVVAKYTARGNNAAALATVRIALVPLAAVSAVSALCLALFRNLISGIQGNTDAAIAYLAISPSLLFAGGISVLRGYFQGKSNMLPSGISQFIEQVIKLFLGLSLGRALMKYGVRYAVCGALVGVSSGELFALAYLAIGFFVSRRKRRVRLERACLAESAQDVVIVTDREILKELYSFALPVTLGSLVLPVTQMIDSALVINLLMYGGVMRAEATAQFGLFVGPVGTLLSMPSVVVVSISVAFLPALTAAVERADGSAERITREVAQWIMLFVIPVALVFMIFPEQVCGALYRRGLSQAQLETAAMLLRVQAVSVFYAGVLQVCTTTLQGHNKAHRPVINLVIGACVKVGLTPVLVRAFGIIGAAGAQAACYAVAATLTARSAYKTAGIGADVKKALILPLASSIAACGVFAGVYALLGFTALSALWKTVIGGAVMLAVYSACALAFGAFPLRKLFRTKKRENSSKMG